MKEIRTNLKIIASNLIRQSGYNAFSFRDLADEVGLKSSSVHYYFPTKADLVEEIIMDYKEAFFENLEAQTAKMSLTTNKLLFLIRLYEESLSNNLNCLCGMLASEIDLLSTKEQKALKGFYNRLEEWLNLEIVDATVKIDIKASEVVHLIMSSLNGAIVLDRAYKRKKNFNALKSFISIAV